MDIGIKNAGFDVKLCVEIDSACCETLRTNLRSTIIVEGDVRDQNGQELLKKAGLDFGELDLLFGGPPCQTFSLAGRREGLNDPRGELVFEFVRLVEELQPRSFIMENVKGMASWENGELVERLKERLSKASSSQDKYFVNHSILNAKDFGVPQNRERIFIVGAKAVDIQLPSSTVGLFAAPKMTVADALKDLPAADEPSKVAQRVSGTIRGRIASHGY